MTQDFESASTCQTQITLATLDTMNNVQKLPNKEMMLIKLPEMTSRLQISFNLSNFDNFGYSRHNQQNSKVVK